MILVNTKESAMPNDQTPQQNHLLAALPPKEYGHLAASLELVSLPLGYVLYESGSVLHHVYFPTTAIVSLLCVMLNGASTEIAVVGNEGVTGLALFMGGGSMPHRAVVQSAGYAYRLQGPLLKDEFNHSQRLQQLLLHYGQALMTQITQTAACNRHHSLNQQLCRRLLMNLDRLPCDELVMTQEMISNMLGVRRESVTEAAGKLQRAGLIQYSRGHIKVINRTGLEANVCECYAIVKKESERLLPECIAP
jgi:CRP-like cAMP-binding protein